MPGQRLSLEAVGGRFLAGVQSARSWPWVAMFAAALALATRLPHVLSSSFPLGDGGLFYLMARGLAESFPRLPLEVGYGAARVPFAYPPLGFYAAAVVDRLGPWDMLQVMRFLPLAFSVLSAAAAWPLLRSLAPWPRSLAALVVFVLLPRSWNWEIVGGGITRAPGLLFLLLSLNESVRLARGQGGRMSALWAALAFWSHPEMGLMAVAHPVFFAVALAPPGTRWRALTRAAVVSAAAVATTVPWWAYVSVTYGADTWLGAATGSRYGPLATLSLMLFPFFYGEPGVPWLAILGLAGVVFMALRREPLPLAWLVLLFLLDPRKAPTLAALPLSLGASWAALTIASRAQRLKPQAASVTLAVLVCVGATQALLADRSLVSPLETLSPEDRSAMEWLRDHTPADARVLTLSGLHWARDAASEWLPALSGRDSVLTVQGSEWLGRGQFLAKQEEHADVQRCAREGECSGGLLAARYRADYVFVYSRCRCARAREGLRPLLADVLYVPTADGAP